MESSPTDIGDVKSSVFRLSPSPIDFFNDDGDNEGGDDDDDIAMKTTKIRSCVRVDDWSSYLDQNVDKLRRLS